MNDNRPHILIVDDEKNTSRTMAMALEAVGYTTTEAASGEEGLTIAAERHPALIILDYQMNGMDGIETLRRLRQDPWGGTAPVIIASNVYDVDIINAIIGLGVQDYVLKSDINLDDIIKLVGRYAPLPAQPEQ